MEFFFFGGWVEEDGRLIMVRSVGQERFFPGSGCWKNPKNLQCWSPPGVGIEAPEGVLTYCLDWMTLFFWGFSGPESFAEPAEPAEPGWFLR